MRYIPILLVIIIIILPAVTLLSLRKEIGLKQTNEGKILFFHGKKDYQFSFISPKENLNSVVLKLKNISIRNSKPVYFNLLDNQKTVRQIRLNGSNIGDSDMVRFAFKEIRDSKNKKYTVNLSSPESEKSEELGIHTDILNDPVIITYHIPSSRLKLMFNVYENFATKILADKIFFLIWLISLSLFAYILLPHRFQKHS